MEFWQQEAPPPGYDRGRHKDWLAKMDYIDDVEIPKAIVGKDRIAHCRMIHIGMIADGQSARAKIGGDGAVQKPSIPGSGSTFMLSLIGTGKTEIANTFGGVYDIPFQRIQLTADMMPADIIGSRVFDEQKGEYIIAKGPLLKGQIILADELPRATPKTQSAFLQYQESWEATIWDKTFRTDPEKAYFVVLGTGNPIESEGTYVFSDALVDRYAQFLRFDPLTKEEEMLQLLRNKRRAHLPESALRPVMTVAELIELRRFRRMFVSPTEDTELYLVRVTQALRSIATEDEDQPLWQAMYLGGMKGMENGGKAHGQVFAMGPSDRAMCDYFQNMTLAHAFRRGAWRATPDDARAVAVPVLAHRMKLTPAGLRWQKDEYPNVRVFEFLQLATETVIEKIPLYPKAA